MRSKMLFYNQACGPDGNFRVDPRSYSVWSASGFFQITLSGGPLAFAQAKAIDVAWDIVRRFYLLYYIITNMMKQVVGRGGQFALAFVFWRVLAKYLTTCMEVQPINYQLFRSIFLENDASLASSYVIIRNFFSRSRGRLRSVTAMVFIASALLYIAAFPTIISAMSGYDSEVSSYFLDENSNMIPFSDFKRVTMIVHDGWRVNLTGDYANILPSGMMPSSPLGLNLR